MPAMELMDRYQKAVLWQRASDDRYGNPTIQSAQQLNVRWENLKLETLDPNNQVITIDAKIHTTVTINIGSIIWEGKLADLPSDTTAISDLYQIVTCEIAKDLKGRVTRKEYGAKRFTTRLPTVVQ